MRKDRRTSARVLLMQRIFGQSFMERLELPFLNYEEKVKYDKKLYGLLLEMWGNHKSDIDDLIKEYAPQRPLKDMDPVALSVLRLAIAEILYYKETPFKVVVDQAIEITKHYSGENEYKLVNGVLGKIYDKEIDEEESK